MSKYIVFALLAYLALSMSYIAGFASGIGRHLIVVHLLVVASIGLMLAAGWVVTQ